MLTEGWPEGLGLLLALAVILLLVLAVSKGRGRDGFAAADVEAQPTTAQGYAATAIDTTLARAQGLGPPLLVTPETLWSAGDTQSQAVEPGAVQAAALLAHVREIEAAGGALATGMTVAAAAAARTAAAVSGPAETLSAALGRAASAADRQAARRALHDGLAGRPGGQGSPAETGALVGAYERAGALYGAAGRAASGAEGPLLLRFGRLVAELPARLAALDAAAGPGASPSAGRSEGLGSPATE
jgi:hypothetical protein